MPNFYAESGDVQVVSTKTTAREAALDLITQRHPDRKLTHIIAVSEKGFNAGPANEVYFETKDILEEAKGGPPLLDNSPPKCS